jgi:hypothetical protein
MFKSKKVETPQVAEIREVVKAPAVAEQVVENEDREVVESEKQVWSLQTIPTQTTTVIYNSKTETAYTLEEAIVEILNRTEE